MSQVYQSNNVINDPEINNYIKTLGSKLSIGGTEEKLSLKFFIINDPSINAFAMLGGINWCSYRTYFCSKYESELSSVLSHEIAHITQKHLLRLFDSQARNSFKSYLLLQLQFLLRDQIHKLPGSNYGCKCSSVQNTLDFTRENEKEAEGVWY